MSHGGHDGPEHASAGYVAQIMGMPISVHLRGPDPRGPRAAAAVDAVFAQLRQVDALFSTYRDDSEVSRLGAGTLAVADAHPWVREVLRLAELARLRTDGLFDVLLAGPAGTVFDPSGIVKGWAAQRACALLRGLGQDFCLNAGGDVVTGRVDDDSPGWRTGIEDPRPGGSLLGVVEVGDAAVATSGTRARGQHVVDPRDGSRPGELLSVTVVGPSLVWADVLATAAFVRGADAVHWLRGQVGYRCVAVLADGSVQATPGLALERVPVLPQTGASVWTSSTTSAIESTTLVGR